MKYCLITLNIISYCITLTGQKYTADLILLGSAGENVYSSALNLNFSFSIGEVIIRSDDDNYHTGFHQPLKKSKTPPPSSTKEDYNPVITPNGDGYNDDFHIEPPIIEPVDFKVYDKWGSLVYSENNFTNSWVGIGFNGKSLPGGVFGFIIIDKSGKIIHKGTITLKF